MFKDILLDLMAEKGINQRQLSVGAQIPPTTISGWINANRLPDYSALIKLAVYFDVSADYLLGLSDEFSSSISIPEPLAWNETELLGSYRSLSSSGKARAAAYIDLLLEQESSPHVKPPRKK